MMSSYKACVVSLGATLKVAVEENSKSNVTIVINL